jgi:hypothetical protein
MFVRVSFFVCFLYGMGVHSGASSAGGRILVSEKVLAREALCF